MDTFSNTLLDFVKKTKKFLCMLKVVMFDIGENICNCVLKKELYYSIVEHG